jgi:hypothetical protein
MRACNHIVSGSFFGADLEPGTFHGGKVEPGVFHRDEELPPPIVHAGQPDTSQSPDQPQRDPAPDGESGDERSELPAGLFV